MNLKDLKKTAPEAKELWKNNLWVSNKLFRVLCFRRHDIQHNDTENNDIQDDTHHNNKYNVTFSIKDTEHNVKNFYAECQLYSVSFMLTVTYKPIYAEYHLC